jgi:hypothetical protein
MTVAIQVLRRQLIANLFRLVLFRLGRLYVSGGLSFFPESSFVALGFSISKYASEFRVTLLLLLFTMDIGWLRDPAPSAEEKEETGAPSA